MAALAPLMQAINALKTASEGLTYLREVDKKFDKAELKIKVAELAEALSVARLSVLDAKEENESLRAKLRELEGAKERHSNAIHKNNLYYFHEGEREDGPFCPRCFENDKKRMPVTKLNAVFKDVGSYQCPNCKAYY